MGAGEAGECGGYRAAECTEGTSCPSSAANLRTGPTTGPVLESSTRPLTVIKSRRRGGRVLPLVGIVAVRQPLP